VETGRLLELGLKSSGATVTRGTVGDVPVAILARSIDAAIGVEPVGVYIMPEAGFYPNSFLAALTLLRNVDSIADVRVSSITSPDCIPSSVRYLARIGKKATLMQKIKENSTLLGSSAQI